MKYPITHTRRTKAFRILVASLFTISVPLWSTTGSAQTYTWADTAQGQVYEICVDGAGNQHKAYWPSNSLWSQSLAVGRNCDDTADIISAPSNWSPAPPKGVYPGGPGALGADVVLGAPANTIFDYGSITLNSLTIQPDGALSLVPNASITANRFDFQSDGMLTGGEIVIASGGTLVKSGGPGTLSLGVGANITLLIGHHATIQVNSGQLVFPAGNNDTLLDTGGTFAISNSAAINLVPDNNTGTFLDGDFSGVGGGTVFLSAGVLSCGVYAGFCSLNFPGTMFQWTGGQLAGGGLLTNFGTINVSGQPIFGGNGVLANQNRIILAPGSTLATSAGTIANAPGALINLAGDASITGTTTINNQGWFKKSSGTGVSSVFPTFKNYAGTVEVDSGTLALNLGGGANVFSNTTLLVATGATLDLSISNNNTRIAGLMTGSGGGTVYMNNGAVFCDSLNGPATLNFPGEMFRWAGGSLGGESSQFLTNANTINLTGPVVMDNYFANNGLIIQSGLGEVGGHLAQLANQVSGVYRIQNDQGVAINILNNFGRLEKTGGSGISVISAFVNNSGTIQADSGTLLFSQTFNQLSGTLQLTPAITFDPSQTFHLIGGTLAGVGTLATLQMSGGTIAPGHPFGTLSFTGAGGFSMSGGAMNIVLGGATQFGQIEVTGNASIEGSLNVTITNGFAPEMGTTFKILSCANRGGEFAKLNVPAGLSVNYSNSGVFLVVTGTVPVQIQSPQVSNGNFSFSFGTISGQSYTVQQNTNLATPNWTYFTNLIGNGLSYQFLVPVGHEPQLMFRLRQP